MESKGILTKIANVLREVDKVVANLLFNKSKIYWISDLNLSQTTKDELENSILTYSNYANDSYYNKLAKNVLKCHGKKISFKNSKHTYLNLYVELAFKNISVNNKIDASIEKYRESIQIVSKGMIKKNYFQRYDYYIDDTRIVRRKLKILFKSLGYPTILDDVNVLNNLFPESLFEKFKNEFYNYCEDYTISNQLYNSLISALIICIPNKYTFDKYCIPRNN